MRSGSTPRRSVATNWEGGVIPWFKTGELRDGPLIDSVEHVTTASGVRLFKPDTILMAIYGSPTVGRLGWVTQPSSCNQAALAVRAHDPRHEQDWLWYQLVALRDHFNSMAQGAAQQNISKEKVAGTRVVLPPQQLRAAFAETAGSARRLGHELSSSNRALVATRDLLLPRLVTGRLDISDVDLGDLLPSEAA
jgi:type I restriction enzyme S subunit